METGEMVRSEGDERRGRGVGGGGKGKEVKEGGEGEKHAAPSLSMSCHGPIENRKSLSL